jgi:hypothetical protein
VWTVALSLFAAVAAAEELTELDFDALEIVATVPRPITLVAEPPFRPDETVCDAILAERPTDTDGEDRDRVLARAHTCFAWKYGADPRSTAGLYAVFVREADPAYCRVRKAVYDGSGPERATDWTALDAATATSELCVVDPATPPLRRNPYERVQTALSEARLGAYVEGGAADRLHRQVEHRTGVSRSAFLGVLRELDASGEPVAAFLLGERDHVWRPRELRRAAVERLRSEVDVAGASRSSALVHQL